MADSNFDISSLFSDKDALQIIKSIRDASADMDTLSQIMKEEYDFFRAGQHVSNTQLWRRLLLRNSFCSIQASLNLMKVFINIFKRLRPGRVSRAEESILLEENYYISDSGNAQRRPNFPEMAKNTKFIFRLFSHVVLIDKFQLDTQNPGWVHYRNSIKVRNRLTHPNSISDLRVQDAELTQFFTGWDWYTDEFGRLFKIMQDRADKTYTNVDKLDLSAKDTLSLIYKIYT